MTLLRGWRTISWIWLGFNGAVILIVIFSGSGGVGECFDFKLNSCLGKLTVTKVALAVWLPTNIVLGGIWVLGWVFSRRCPTCSAFMRRGRYMCSSCGRDLREAPGRTSLAGQAWNVIGGHEQDAYQPSRDSATSGDDWDFVQ